MPPGLFAEFIRSSIQVRFTLGSRLPKNSNCTGIDGCIHTDVRPPPAEGGLSHERVKLSLRRSLATITALNWRKTAHKA